MPTLSSQEAKTSGTSASRSRPTDEVSSEETSSGKSSVSKESDEKEFVVIAKIDMIKRNKG